MKQEEILQKIEQELPHYLKLRKQWEEREKQKLSSNFDFEKRKLESSQNYMQGLIKQIIKSDPEAESGLKEKWKKEWIYEPEKLKEMIKELRSKNWVEKGKNQERENEKEIRNFLNKYAVMIEQEIKEELKADLKELERCYQNQCYRSTIILCGRILEVVLHRKYYESTGNDLLETSPGIGLGNLIGRIKKKGIALGPGLDQQIHLINQIRVGSVHKKKETFYPTKEQAFATMLFTLDIVKKLLKKG